MFLFVRTCLIAALLLGTLVSTSVRAQEAPAEDEVISEEVVAEDVIEPAPVALDRAIVTAQPAQPVLETTAVPTPAPLPSPTATPMSATIQSGKVKAAVVDNRFQPSSLTVAVGSTVTWTNNGNNSHTLSSLDGLFDSGGLFAGQSFSYTFDKAGTYRLICRQHGLNGMTAQVIVQ